jgi:hypothetical protein
VSTVVATRGVGELRLTDCKACEAPAAHAAVAAAAALADVDVEEPMGKMRGPCLAAAYKTMPRAPGSGTESRYNAQLLRVLVHRDPAPPGAGRRDRHRKQTILALEPQFQ